jgi:CheY-like chemotaxis protein
MNTPVKPLFLVVDDSKTSRLLITRMVIEMRPDWRIVEAASGDEALKLAQAEMPDFVSMDINMPGMSGLEAAGRLRMIDQKVRTVLCTANVQESMRHNAEKLGLHFVAKPITPNTIAEMIEYFER